MNLFELFVKIGVDDQASDKISGLSNKLGNGLKTAAKVGAAAITAASAATVAFAKSSIDAGMAFDSSMSQVAATMGTTVDQISELRDFALEMGASTAFSASQAADALNYMALAGYDAEQAMEALPNVLNLAAAGGIELAAASDMVTDAQSALGLSMEESSIMVDQMAKTASKSNTSVAQLGEAILTVGGTASYMAGGTEQINKVLGVLADNGIKGAEAGTHLRNMLLSLSAPTSDAQAIIDKFGLQIFDAEGKMRDFADIFPELNAAMEGLTEQEKLDAFAKLFNTRDIASATALLNTSVERWDELGSAIVDSKGAAEAMANTQLDNLEGDITLFKSALEGAQITISDSLTPAIREFVQFATDKIGNLTREDVDNFLKSLQNLLPVITGLTAAMVAYKAASAISGIIDALRKATESQTIAQTLLNAVMNANPFALIATLIAGLVTAVITLWHTNEGFRNALISAWEAIKGAAETIFNAVANFFTETIPNAFNNVIDWFKDIGKKFSDIGKNIVEGIKSGIKKAWNNLVSWFKGLFGDLIGIAKKILGIASPSKVFKQIGGFTAEGFGEGFEDKFAHVKDDMEDALNFDDASVGINASIHKVGAGAADGAFGTVSTDTALASEIKGLRNDVKNLKIYLSTGALVGGVTDGIDHALGQKTVANSRRRLATSYG